MSLRQLKFKPKFPLSKVKKNEETSTKEVADIKKIDASSPPECIESSTSDQKFPISKETKCKKENAGNPESKISKNNEKVSDVVQATLKTNDVIGSISDQKFPISQETNYKQENAGNPESEISKNNEKVSDVVQATLKTNDVIGKTVLPSLRQLKCKPKLNFLPSRFSNKVVTTVNHQRISEHDIGIDKADPPLSGEEPSATKSSSASSESDLIKENNSIKVNNLEKLISDKIQNLASELQKPDSCEKSSATKSLSTLSESVSKESNLRGLISDRKQNENDSDVLQTSASCEESFIRDKALLPEHNSNTIIEINDDLRPSKEKISSEKYGNKENEDLKTNTDLGKKSLNPIVLNIGINTPLSSPIVRLDSAEKENANNSGKLEEAQSPDKKENQVQNEGDSVKNEVICRHMLPIRQINLPPKLRRPWVQNKIFKSSSSLIKNVDSVNKCEDSEKKGIVPPSVEKKDIAEESTPESKELKCLSINNISNSINLNGISKNALDSSKKIKTHVRKEIKSLNKPLKSMKNTHANSKKSESSLSDAEDLLKNSSEPVKEKKSVTDARIDNSLKKKEAKNRAVYGSKSIRSCHLGIPFKPKLTNRSKKPFASSTFGKMCFEAKAQFEKKFKDKEPDSTKLTMLDLIFYNPSSNPMPQEEKKLKTVSIKNTKNIDVPEETPDIESPDHKNKSTDSNDVPVPQLKLSSDGKVIIAQESLVVEQSLGEISDNIEEITTERFKKKKNNSEEGCRAGWSHLETLKFYKALNSLGSDFETMKSMFPGRSRSNLKSKFKREERLHGKLIDKIMSQPSEFIVQKATEELNKSREEKETNDLYNLTIQTLGRNLKAKKVSARETKEKHHLILKNTVERPRKKKKPEKIKEVPSDLDNDDECLIPIRRKMPKRDKNPTNNAHRVIGTSDKNNIVISTNIEYDHLKLTQFITYNSNNLDNPIEVNTTIAHDTPEAPVSEVLDLTSDN